MYGYRSYRQTRSTVQTGCVLGFGRPAPGLGRRAGISLYVTTDRLQALEDESKVPLCACSPVLLRPTPAAER
jgi:hypothetical protein